MAASGSVTHDQLANTIRALTMDAVEAAGSGHPGMPMGMADVATVLWTKFLKFDPQHPEWPDRDRFILSNGHGSMLLYSLLHLTGYPDMRLEDLEHYRKLGWRTPGHPEHGHSSGIETTTGPLGQGIATSVGLALAEAHLAARFGSELVDHRTWVFAGDGCMMEGVSHEAAALAGHLRLKKLTVLYDDNHVSIDGPTTLAYSDNVLERFEAYGWVTDRIDGHDPAAIEAAMKAALDTDRPCLIACKTVIGKGAPNKAGTSKAHGSALGADEVAGARKELGWEYPPFEVPEEIRSIWREAGERGRKPREEWTSRLEGTPERAAFEHAFSGNLPEGFDSALSELKAGFVKEKPKLATRKASEETLKVLTEIVPEMLGGSADLTPSNNTKTPSTADIEPGNYAGRYVRYGVREHGMMAAMNGLALHGGIIPYGGTFLTFSDYARPAIRIGAIMGSRAILVGTHDSIGLGEDGPTHQPIEHLASLRAIPNLLVFRPADSVETAECWEVALRHRDRPSVMALSRQNLETFRDDHEVNRCDRGAYVLVEADGERQATILSTGSEIGIAMAAREQLAAAGIRVAVVSMPCWELFEREDDAYRNEVLGSAPRVAVEAASPFGWTRYVAREADVVGMTTFGASGDYEEVYKHFGITVEAVANRVRSVMDRH